MRFGVMHDFRNPQRWHVPSPVFYESMIGQVQRMEELGYDHVWLTEHHFTEDAYNPVPLAMACALAARTRSIRIGTFVMLMPFMHPVRAAEEVVLADILSNGRFDLGVGQGYTHEEFDAFCVPRGERGARLEEGVTLMRKLLSEENVSFEGRFTRVKNVTLMPRPVQQPVPIWIGARGPKAIRRAAALGANLMTTLGPDPVPEYVAALRELGRDPASARVAQLRMVYVADSDDQAWEEAQHHLWHVFDYYRGVLSTAADVEGDAALADWPLRRAEDLRDSALAADLFVGSPASVAEKLDRFAGGTLCTDFILSTHFAGIDVRKSTRSLELFAQEIMPAFRGR
jgi:alkanesulfonate monooxygenase SsuD/methylene tetrahydromethanopterin reductase-like flavin-dependent oxidoreductase (luciferase family)